MKLQEQFVKNVKLACGQEGEKWLKELPELLSYCESRWNLTIGFPYTLSYNYVAPAVRKDGSEVVVKLWLPEDGYKNERETLQTLKSKGIVNLIDHDQKRRILILDKITPGHNLAKIQNDTEAVSIASEVLSRLGVKPEKCHLPSTREREKNLTKFYKKNPYGLGPISAGLILEALQVFTYLNQSMSKRVVLHGDFHHYNILQSGSSWTAIDPKGLVGEVEYDIIQYLLNCLPEEGKFKVISRRIEIFIEKLGLNKERLLLWGFAHTVLATCWTINKQSGDYNSTFYEGIYIFQKLYYDNFSRTIARRLN
ncbi:aminoglycoside phosphotransferase family protein [Halobacillus massiliensis]|uniref:aminoglycoside phosphotransferase family protein n=1 Tax=Halobacillus massiliensis TaxID=1926286 RepID=UPI0009E23F24|nr:aminoglycoside phosphotransferase family protein [Halobacillus massiliensis]